MKKSRTLSLLLAVSVAFAMATQYAFAAGAQNNGSLEVGYLTLAPGSDASQLTFSWHTSERADSPVVRILKDGGEAMEFTGACGATASSISAMYQNVATAAGLEADTAYAYQVGDGRGNWSDWRSTKTGNPDAFSYIVVGDPQIGSSDAAADAIAWASTMDIVGRSFPGAAFMAGTGDQIETSSTLSHYTGYFAPPQMASLPFASCMGNHEGSGAATRAFYNPPNADGVQNYWFRYGGALFLVWNCTTGTPGAMRAFLSDAIGRNGDAAWTILNFHYDVYGQGSSHALSDGKAYRDQYVPVIDEFGIDVVFNGHDHSYSRSYPMKWSGSPETSSSQGRQPETFGPGGESIDPAGTVYFSLNSSTGSKYYSLVAQQYYTATMQQANRPHFSVVDISDGSFACATYQIEADGSLAEIDAYSIKKSGSAVDPEPGAPLALATDKNIVRPDEYFNISVSFKERSESNVIKLDFAFDPDLFSFAGYTPAEGSTLLTREYGEGYASVMAMSPGYGMEGLGKLMLKAGPGVAVGTSTITAAAVFVERDQSNAKAAKEASGSYAQKTNNAGTDGFVVDMIVLSNLVDAFGMAAGHADWENCSHFDFNGNDVIDIFDIVTLAQMIR